MSALTPIFAIEG